MTGRTFSIGTVQVMINGNVINNFHAFVSVRDDVNNVNLAAEVST
jgi:hypothetical protein